MTPSDLLRIILAAADDVGRVFDHTDIVTWPPGALDTLIGLGLLRPAATGLFAPCPNCHGGHIEPVTIRVGPDSTKRYFIWCPESMRVTIQPEMCNGWELDRAGLATAISTVIGLRESPRVVIAERFWRLGRTPWPPGSRATRPVVLAMRLHDSDAAAVAAHVGSGGRAIVLVPYHMPDCRIWTGSAPAVVPLAEVLSLADGSLVLNAEAALEIVQAADRRAEQAEALVLGPKGRKVLSQHVKAEVQSMLTDDAYLAAYKEHGSLRKAADALTKQTGQPVSKDKIRRAVERFGAQVGVVADEDSASVARTVASQRRDRAEKFLERR